MANNCSPKCECKTGGEPELKTALEKFAADSPEVQHSAPYDVTANIIAFEQNELSNEEAIDLFAALVKSGMAWTLQGSYGRAAARLIEGGIISKDGDVLRYSVDE